MQRCLCGCVQAAGIINTAALGAAWNPLWKAKKWVVRAEVKHSRESKLLTEGLRRQLECWPSERGSITGQE